MSNAFETETPRQSACTMLWLCLNDNIPYEWALAEPKSVGLTESFRLDLSNKKLRESVERRIRHMAGVQHWGERKPLRIRSGATLKTVLDCYF